MFNLVGTMIGSAYVAFFLVSPMVFGASGAEVYVINTKSTNGDLNRLVFSIDKKTSSLDLVSSDDPSKSETDQIFKLYKRPDNTQQKLTKNDYRILSSIFGSPRVTSQIGKKYRRPRFDKNKNELDPFIRYFLGHNHKTPDRKPPFEDLTRGEKKFSEDYVDFGEITRGQTKPKQFSQDYIDFTYLRKNPTRLRRARRGIKTALRSYSDDSDENDDDDTKSKRFEVVKNKHNKKDIRSDSESFEERPKKKNSKKSKSLYLDSDEDFSELSDKEASKSKIKKRKKKVLEEEDNKDEDIGMYLQGNKLTVYPPVDPDSAEESDDTRRDIIRRMRMPYFLPKRYKWTEEDVPKLGYFFFNGPKGMSLESD